MLTAWLVTEPVHLWERRCRAAIPGAGIVVAAPLSRGVCLSIARSTATERRGYNAGGRAGGNACPTIPVAAAVTGGRLRLPNQRGLAASGFRAAAARRLVSQ
jgi:hypothetical protein